MKRLLLFSMAIMAMATSAMAQQSVIVVDSERIFRSIEEYNTALSTIETMSSSYQSQVDARFDAVAEAFAQYALEKSSYSPERRRLMERSILNQESEATKFQEQYFASDGVIMQERLRLIAPIQRMVFESIEEYAESCGVELVLDSASNPSILYSTKGMDHTEAIIKLIQNR